MRRRPIIGVMGAGDAATPGDMALAEELGERIAREGWVLLNGGRREGIMGAASRGAKRVEGSLTIGVLPGSSRQGASADLDVAIVTGMGSARNNINALSCDVIIACGCGGPGTFSEVALAVKAGTPVVLLGSDPTLVALFERAVAAVPTVDEAVIRVRAFLSR